MIKTISKITVGLLVLTLVLAFTSCNSIGYNPSSVACLNFYAFVPTEYQISEDINVITINGTAKDNQIQAYYKRQIDGVIPKIPDIDKGIEIDVYEDGINRFQKYLDELLRLYNVVF